MPLVFAGIVPHPPVLIPEIGQDNIKKLTKTLEAVKKLEQDLYAAKPESLVIISPHGKIQDEAFTINLNADYVATFKEFGNFDVELKFKSDYMTIQQIRAADESNQVAPIALSSEAEIDHGFGVPLYLLTKHLKNIPIVPITYSGLSYQEHFAFGQFLYRQLAKINKRFAVIASADLSHTVTKTAPGGYSPKAKDFDKNLISQLKKQEYAAIVKTSPKLIKEVAVCGTRSIIVLLGIIESLNTKPEVLSYEAPFGVGYAVCNFKLA